MGIVGMVVNTGKCQTFVLDVCIHLLKGIYKFNKYTNVICSVEFIILIVINICMRKGVIQ